MVTSRVLELWQRNSGINTYAFLEPMLSDVEAILRDGRELSAILCSSENEKIHHCCARTGSDLLTVQNYLEGMRELNRGNFLIPMFEGEIILRKIDYSNLQMNIPFIKTRMKIDNSIFDLDIGAFILPQRDIKYVAVSKEFILKPSPQTLMRKYMGPNLD